MKRFVSRFICVAAALVCPLFAWSQDARSMLDVANREVAGVVGNVVDLAFLLIGIVGLAMLVPNLMKYLKGDPSSNDALMKVGAGIVIVIIIAQVIRMVFFNNVTV